ncbi:MAG: DUF1667 domain-containing protein [PVC group bacterium]|nr:DUF1667 domain-containing protein [PVC group bacterium]
MNKKIICIECPQGCDLMLDIQDGKLVSVIGNKCAKGEAYAAAEIQNPMRILTSTVLAENMSFKMVPVKTSKPIPKAKIKEAMKAIKKIRLNRIVLIGDVIAENLLGLEVNLIATRDC